VTFVDRTTEGEERWEAIGWIEDIAIFVVVHTYREEDNNTEVIRIISARRAKPGERTLYAQTNA
jgi:uncharacterized protein